MRTARRIAASTLLCALAGTASSQQSITLEVRGEAGFGPRAVALSGTRAVVGSLTPNAPPPYPPGEAFLFDVETATAIRSLTPPGILALDFYAQQVGIGEGLVVVNARGDDEAATNAGAVYVYDATNGAPVRKLLPVGSNVEDAGFGFSLAIGNGWIVAGAPYSATQVQGNVQIFDAATGAHLRTLTASDAGVFDRFGTTLALDGDTIVVGADGGSPGIYVFDGRTGQELRKIDSVDTYGLFPARLAVGGGKVAGTSELTFCDVELGDCSDAVRVFDLTTGVLDYSHSQFGTSFGAALSIDGGVLEIGAARADGPFGERNAGAMFAYDLVSGAQLSVTYAPGHQPGRGEGGSFARDGERTLTASAFAGEARLSGCFPLVPGPDCDGDGVNDACAIEAGAADCDADGVPDACQPDCDGDGVADACEPDCDADGVPDDCATDCNGDGIPDLCQVFNDCDGDGVPNACEDDLDGNGFPDECQELSTYCFGLSCPCGNDGFSTGCTNSGGSGAALVPNGGGVSIAADDLELLAVGLPAGNVIVLFAADTSTNPPVVFGDGLTCTGGLSHRYPVAVAEPNGTATFSALVAGAPADFLVPGVSRGFQLFYRDVLCGPPPAPCPTPCGGSANLTNGVRVLYAP